MVAKMKQSKGSNIGFRVVDTVTKEDYELLTPALHELLAEYPQINLLLNLEEFGHEEIRAWMSDLKFGQEFRKQIVKLAIVGDQKWQELLAKLAEPFFAKEARHFSLEQEKEAWKWLSV